MAGTNTADTGKKLIAAPLAVLQSKMTLKTLK